MFAFSIQLSVCLLFILGGTWASAMFQMDDDGKDRPPSSPSKREILLNEESSSMNELAYGTLVQILLNEYESEEKRKSFQVGLQTLTQKRADILDRIDVLSGLLDLNRKERSFFCLKLSRISENNKIPGWVIYQATQCPSKVWGQFLNDLNTYLLSHPGIPDIEKPSSQEEALAFQSLCEMVEEEGRLRGDGTYFTAGPIE